LLNVHVHFNWRRAILIVKYGDTAVTCAKTAEPIEMPLGLKARMDPRTHVLDRSPDLPWKGAILGERGANIIVKYIGTVFREL